MNCETIRLLVLALVILTFYDVQGVRNRSKLFRPCKQEQNEYYYGGKGCKKCDKCPPGKQPVWNDERIQMDPDKGALTCSGCEECPAGSYKDQRSFRACVTCFNCNQLNRRTDKNCTRTSNAVCGQCLPGHHDIFKHLHNSPTSEVHMPCQKCDFAHKDAPECQHRKPAQSNEETTLSSQEEHSTLLLVVEQKLSTYTVNKDGQESNNKPQYAQAHIALFLSGTLLVLVLGVLIFVIVRLKTSLCRRRTNSIQIEDAESGKPGKSNLCYKHSTENVPCHPSLLLFEGGTRAPLLSGDVTTDGEDGAVDKKTNRDDAVATREHISLVTRMIGKDYKDIARVLKIPEPEIEKLEINHLDASERIFQLLFCWRKQQGEAATIGRLCRALMGVGRNDVANKLREMPM